ncbi:TPA: NADH-quinone oxidoreductase subunit NuoE [Candidatus Poribacteria bacterium]|nr:NADH-quinone oxidoreductase subunit NuoE [Candidatus Poribacteria bacterium]
MREYMETSTKSNANQLDLNKLDELFKNFNEGDESLLIPLLQASQELYGYLSMPVLEKIAQHLHIPLSRAYGVATFYAQFRFKPSGKYVIKVCRGTACHVRGSKNILEAIERELGIKNGDVTPDLKFSLETVACLGTCFLAPVMMINDRYYGKLTNKTVQKILKEY